MTVHVHKSVGAVSIGEHTHERPTPKKGTKAAADAEESRTWTFECEPECESQFLKAVELAGSSEVAVPLTHDEKREADELSVKGTRAAGELFKALVDGAKETVASGAR